jgi:hypothetical protein
VNEVERERHRLKAARYRELYPEKAKAANALQNEKVKAVRDQKIQCFLVAQRDRCAICGTTEAPAKGWHLDHDHSCCTHRLASRRCGQCERGALCANCNTALGSFRDDPVILLEALKSLARWGKFLR